MILVTGSAGHLGEALIRVLKRRGDAVRGLDIKPSPFTEIVASVSDSDAVAAAMVGVETVLHTATLHKPHVATHAAREFVETNVNGTLTLLEAAVKAGARMIFTSTTSAFGAALRPPPGAPTAWVTEEVQPVPRNIYGVTKIAAEDLCHLFHRKHDLPVLILRTSRFFPEDDDSAATRAAFSGPNAKCNELTHRRGDISDMVSAHLAAMERADDVGFDRLIISATPPFEREDIARLRDNAAEVLAERVPCYPAIYNGLGWHMHPGIDRVYDNKRARHVLGWEPEFTFEAAIQRLADGQTYTSDLTAEIGIKGYHDQVFEDGPFPVEE